MELLVGVLLEYTAQETPVLVLQMELRRAVEIVTLWAFQVCLALVTLSAAMVEK